MNHKLKFLFDIQDILLMWGLEPDQANVINIVFGILNVVLLAWLVDFITRRIIIVLISRFVAKTRTVWDDILLEKKVFKNISHLAPALVFWYSTGYVLGAYESLMNVVQKAISIYMIIAVLLAISAFLKGVNEIYMTLPAARGRSIKGYIQVVQIFFHAVAIISIISVITDTPTGKLITGLGAAAAVLMLVFKDTILGLVAGVQLSSNDMLRIGDWITMAKYGADGHVIEISLITVKVKNFDKTITTIPTYTLVSDSFINWRGIEEESSRRFKKYINIDMKTVRFCTPDMIQRLSSIKSIREFIERNEKKSKKQDPAMVLHDNEITNLTLFRKYVVGVLRNHNGLNQKMSMVVRQLQPTENGLPLEIVAFVKGTDGLVFEEIQSDLVDHLLGVMPEFGLAVFQADVTITEK